MPQPPRASDDEDARFSQFLTEEVRTVEYADLLRDRAEAVHRGKGTSDGEAPPGASGNAYYVTFGRDEIIIEHHYLGDWPAVRVAYPRFLAALSDRRKQL
ncbi:MAG TPA: hypothetical protein VND94_09595 [Terriglobia bacterium]|nr:hypothetical protein [Terriglobia bacterium]